MRTLHTLVAGKPCIFPLPQQVVRECQSWRYWNLAVADDAYIATGGIRHQRIQGEILSPVVGHWVWEIPMVGIRHWMFQGSWCGCQIEHHLMISVWGRSLGNTVQQLLWRVHFSVRVIVQRLCTYDIWVDQNMAVGQPPVVVMVAYPWPSVGSLDSEDGWKDR